METCAYCKIQTVQLIADKNAPTEWQEWITGRQQLGEDEVVMTKRFPIIQTKLCFYHNKMLVGLFGVNKMNTIKRKVLFS